MNLMDLGNGTWVVLSAIEAIEPKHYADEGSKIWLKSGSQIRVRKLPQDIVEMIEEALMDGNF